MDRRDTMMGAETEYALVVLDHQGRRVDPDVAAARLMKLACACLPHLVAADGQGIFLTNGGKFYIDVGGHPEWATPECLDPWELVRYTLAGDRILGQLARAYQLAHRGCTVHLFRGNTGYAADSASAPESWACHESYLCRRPPNEFVADLAPFLVSRIVYAGSGGFNPFKSECEFTISPRSHFLTAVAGKETMRDRPIVNLRDEPLADGYRRLHLIAADALGSQTAMALRSGATALVVRLIDEGLAPGGVRLRDALGALRAFAADPTLRATACTIEGQSVTALDLQERYREAAEAHRDRLPSWAPQILAGWGRTLQALRTRREAVDRMLDWAIKERRLADHAEHRAPLIGSDAGLRAELLELDTRFLQVVPDGLWRSLESAGAIDHSVVKDSSIAAAMEHPPACGRAALRGRLVQERAGQSEWRAAWIGLFNAKTGQSIRLADPFAQSPVQVKGEAPPPSTMIDPFADE